jgi:hypothetical protein
MFKSLVKIINVKTSIEPFIEPIEGFWSEMKHTRATLLYLKALIEDKNAGKNFLENWNLEVHNLECILPSIEKNFCKAYLDSLCVLREFEIKKYDRAYLEIAFTKHLKT